MSTSIASGAVSVSYAAVELAVRKILEPGDFSYARVLVIGAGKIGKLVIKHLAIKECKKMIVVNRMEDKVSAIRKESKGVEIIFRPFDQLLTSAAEADIVFTCTASETPLFLKQQVDEFPPASHVVDDTWLFLDISLPRNVDPSISDSRGAKVYNIDDLKEVVDTNNEDRLRKAMEARAITLDESQQFGEWRDSLETIPIIKKLRAYAKRIRMVVLEKCLSKLGDIENGQTLSVTLENMHTLDRIFGLGTELSLLEEKIKVKVE